ncbi:MAG: hypothetical protein R3F53_16410 [Gammaproteobacteria bacterium]
MLLLLGLLLTTSSHSQPADPESAAAAISTPRLVKTLILDSATQGDGLVLPGRVQAAERTQLAFQVRLWTTDRAAGGRRPASAKRRSAGPP